MITIISNYTDDFKATRQLSKGEQALEKVYEDADWVVYIPHTYEASRKIGGDTSWCTASSDDRYFNMYTKEGPLYVNIRKSDGAKFQFHFPTGQFMDINDKEVSIRELGLSEGLVKFYETIYPNFNLYMKYDFVGNFYNGYVRVILNNKYNFIDVLGNMVSPNQWFDWIGNFCSGYAKVKLNNKYNFIDTQGKLLSPNQWFDWIYDFYDGYGIVKLNGKWYKIDTKGNIEVMVNEHTVTITKSDLRKIVLECVKKIMNIS